MQAQSESSPMTSTPRQGQSDTSRHFAIQPPGLGLGTGTTQHYRFADFDGETFSERGGVSADQAKRALRAHLAETERRMAEAGRLGTALVHQQKELTEKLREVEDLQAESELSPELKKKLAEIEKDYDDVARETARAFLPKQRIPSNESAGSPEGKSGRRSLSPVKYDSHASGSPSKLTVSNRKQRNQAANRVHDIEFAAEISTSLISQVRSLQALLAEREEELRDTKQSFARLEDATESLRDRIRELDESEHRYKEENWNLETRIHDLEAAEREAAESEKKTAQQLASLQVDKNRAQRDLDELKVTYSRLLDDHTAAVKHHDIELGTTKRNMAMAESERVTLQRKVDDLASQNQELARAISMQQRARAVDTGPAFTTSDDEFDTAADHVTPEHSPPASPVKGTPRHSVLESETLKTSLLHAQRTLQSLRSSLHREKTEKLEMRRMLQEARDDLERARADPNGAAIGASKKGRKDNRDVQKLRSSQLGGARSSRTELFMLASNDPDWEEVKGEPSPSSARDRATAAESSEQFDTANETHQSDASFETANDEAENTEDFHTGVERMSSSEDNLTETEQDSRRRRGLPPRGVVTGAGADASFDMDPANQSTASTSDDDEFGPPRTPTGALPSIGGSGRLHLRVSRSSLASRRLRHANSTEEVTSSPAAYHSSPFSAADSPAAFGLSNRSVDSTPRVQGKQQSLFAELRELDEESDDGFPSDRTSSRHRNPQLLPSKVVMVDRATLTEAITISPWSEEEEQQRQNNMENVRLSSSIDDAAAIQDDSDMDEKLKQFPSPPTSPPVQGSALAHIVLQPPNFQPYGATANGGHGSAYVLRSGPESDVTFSVSALHSTTIEPVAEPVSVMVLALSAAATEQVEPNLDIAAEGNEPQTFTRSSLHTVDIVPVEIPHKVQPIPVLSVSMMQKKDILPVPEPKVEMISRQAKPFTLSEIQMQHVEPVLEPTEPVALPNGRLPLMGLSSLSSQHFHPVDVESDIKASAGTVTAKAIPVSRGTQTEQETAVMSALGLSGLGSATTATAASTQKTSSTDQLDIATDTVRGLKRNAFIIPRDSEEVDNVKAINPAYRQPRSLDKVDSGFLASGRGSETPIIAEDETRQSPRDSLLPGTPETPESQRPFREISINANSPRRDLITGIQVGTSIKNQHVVPPKELSLDDIARDATPRGAAKASKPFLVDVFNGSETESFGSGKGVESWRARNASQDSTSNSTYKSGAVVLMRAESSSASSHQAGRVPEGRVSNDAVYPPLPVNHREVIEAARTGSAGSMHGSMGTNVLPNGGPPNWQLRTPASVVRDINVANGSETPTPKASNRIINASTSSAIVGDMRPLSRPPSHANASNAGGSIPGRVRGTISRQVSMSSFASEVDARFNMQDGSDVFGNGHGGHTDPRMIQAITQTMIGEYLWKYTRKTARSGMSENRHRRYFWIHPYTRMLYWSDQGPTAGSRAEQRAKSVIIEGVRVVTDDNPMPPGLHRKSLIVISPGRTIKFTCTTGHRHEIWFNALSYLLLGNDEPVDEGGMMTGGGHITNEDVEEFNPSTSSHTQARRRPPVSLSSYNSRTTRNESPAFGMSMNVPTLTPTPKTRIPGATGSAVTPSASVTQFTSRSRLSRIGGYWRSSQSLSAQFNSLRNRSSTPSHRHSNSAAHGTSIYEASEVNDSAEELRALYEAQDRESGRLENVRACCDGKHDVGTLSRGSRRHRHSHAAPSALSTPTHSTTRHRS